MLKGFLKGKQVTQNAKWNEMYKWKDDMWYPGAQDMNLSWYVPKANVDHNIKGQGTSTLDHSVTTHINTK